MKYAYKCASTYLDENMFRQINAACHRLSDKFDKVNLKSTGVSEYNQRYLGDQLNNLTPVLQTYAYLLALSLDKLDKPLEEFCIVDYGAGAGVLSLLAKELGVGTVIYNDIYDISCSDAMELSKVMSLEIDSFICGEINELALFFNHSTFKPDAVISFDVIEHIYDIEGYLKKLPNLSNKPFRIVFGSGANEKNPILRKRYIKAQHECEMLDRSMAWGQKERDTLKAYISIRKEMIQQYAPQLDENTVNSLASQTRGLIQSDIEKCVDEYIDTQSISYKPDHPSNTCDPYTGNWAEHLMSTEWLESILLETNFTATTLNGYWGSSRHILGKTVVCILNTVIGLFKRRALALSPYYVVCADLND